MMENISTIVSPKVTALMRSLLTGYLACAASALAFAADQQAVKETLLVELPDNAIDLIAKFSKGSPHVAWKQRNANKALQVIVDGAKGPEFQDVRNLSWSEDGFHLAYIAKRNDRWLAVVHDKNGDRYSDAAEPSSLPLTISPDGSRLAYVGNGGSVVVDNIVCLPAVSIGFNWSGVLPKFYLPVFSPDSKHVAYGRFIVRGGFKRAAESSMVSYMDGQPLNLPTTTALFIIEDIDDRLQFELSGSSGPEAFGRQFMFSPDSSKLALFMNGGAYVNGERLGGFSADGELYRAAFSADSKHFAFSGEVGTPSSWRKRHGSWAVILDGQELARFDGYVSPPVFSPDGSSVGYVAADNTGSVFEMLGNKKIRPVPVRSGFHFVINRRQFLEHELVTYYKQAATVEHLRFSPTGQLAYVLVHDGTHLSERIERFISSRKVVCGNIQSKEFVASSIDNLQFGERDQDVAYEVHGIGHINGSGAVVIGDTEHPGEVIHGTLTIDGKIAEWLTIRENKIYRVQYEIR